MKKPRTGGSGASRVPLGGTSDGVGERHHTTCLRPYRLAVSVILSHRRGRSPSAIVRLRCQSYPAYPVDWATLRLDESKSGVKYAEHGGGKQVRSKVTLKYHILNDSELSPLSSGHCGARVHI